MITFISTGTVHQEYLRDMLGLIPSFLSESDPRPAQEQFNTAYAHGGGWQRFDGFKLTGEAPQWRLKHPGDPAYVAIAFAQLREETIIVFEHAWVVILQSDGSWECARMD